MRLKVTNLGCRCHGNHQDQFVVGQRSISGFTRIELLSLVLALAALGALVRAGVATMARDSRERVCLANVRQIGVGVARFAERHGEYPLGINKRRFLGSNQLHSTSWLLSIADLTEPKLPAWPGAFLVGAKPWKCPSAQRPVELSVQVGFSDYGYNANGFGLGRSNSVSGIGGSFSTRAGATTAPAIKVNEVVNPGGTLLAGDGFSGWNEVVLDGQSYLERSATAMDRFGSTRRSNRRHNSNANVVFADGHTDSLTLSTLFADTSDQALQLWNRDGLPHRERLME